MAVNTASGRTVFVLGREAHGNRSAFVVEDGEEYSVDFSTAVEYSDGTASFPFVSE